MKDAVKGVIACVLLLGLIVGCHLYRATYVPEPDTPVTFSGTVIHVEHPSMYNTRYYSSYTGRYHYSDIEVSYGDKYAFFRCLSAVDVKEGDAVDCGFSIKHLGKTEYLGDGYLTIDGVKYDGQWYTDGTTKGERSVN